MILDMLKAVEAPDRGLPKLRPGDTVKVHVRIIEGDKERTQVFQGVIIRIRRGQHPNDGSYTVRRIASNGIGVERTFLFKSPRIEKVEVTRSAKVRRAKLYYMRNLRGKAARLKEKRRS